MTNQRGINPLEYTSCKNDQERLEFLVRLAILAPSSHNCQPWLFKIGENKIQVYLNRQRLLPKSDPKGRQVFLSLGAMIETFPIAAKAFSLPDPQITYFNDENFIAEIFFPNLQGSVSDPETLSALVLRHSNRSPFEEKSLSGSFTSSFSQYSDDQIKSYLITDRKVMDKVRLITEESIEEAFKTREFTDELSEWVKPSLSRYQDGMPGYYMGVPKIISFVLPFLIKHVNLSKSQRKMHSEWLSHCQAFAVIAGNKDTREDWLNAGRRFMNIAINCTRQNIKIGLFGAPIEIKEYYKGIQQALGINLRPYMLMRLGYTDKVPKFSPRMEWRKLLIK